MMTFKNGKLLLLIALIAIFVSSCIPSLHPIYTAETRVIDDRIIGKWKMNNQISFDDVVYDISVSDGDTTIQITTESDALERGNLNVPEKFIKSLANIGGGPSTWTFERAANIQYSKKSKSSSASISLSVGARSFVPEGYTIDSEEQLPFYILTHKEIEKDEMITTYLIVNLTKISGDLYVDFVPLPKGDKLRQGAFAANYISGHTFAKINFQNDLLSLEMFDGDFIEDLLRSRRVRLSHEILGEDGNLVLTASTDELRSFIEKYGDNPEMYETPEVLVKS